MSAESTSGLKLNLGECSREATTALREAGCALLPPTQLESACRLRTSELTALSSAWGRLPRDAYLMDGGRYRFRRHSCFVHDLQADSVELTPRRAHWQPTDYNALHGGMERWFEPIESEILAAPIWNRLLRGLGLLFGAVRPVRRWYIEAHQFRIDTAAGIGRPTPEGAHRDGVDYVAVLLVRRINVRGGETRIFDACGSAGTRFTMIEPWTSLLLDDARVIHETTPIQKAGEPGVRDTLVITYRANGFQAPSH